MRIDAEPIPTQPVEVESQSTSQEAISGTNADAWELANLHFNTLKGDYADAILSGVVAVPQEIVDCLCPKVDDDILHLLCNDGREAAYISYTSGSQLTGVDFSRAAVRYARALNKQMNLVNHFVCAEAVHWMESCSEKRFTKIFLTLGSLRWISDLERFFRLARKVLKRGGSLVVWDFHPVADCFCETPTLEAAYPFAPHRHLEENGVKDYVSSAEAYAMLSRSRESRYEDYRARKPIYIYRHSVSEILNAAIASKSLTLRHFGEYEFCWEERYLPWLVEVSPRRFAAKEGEPSIPLAFIAKYTAS